ncbi:MAG: T9SS type A sorting domain-containing protein [Bacteroidetes bacterium]|nr:T9SS type A sorting domain-containing protein [Bacteroidota bacterium]
MKKNYLFLFAFVISLSSVFSQANLSIIAPVGNGATTQSRAPNGNSSHAFLRGCFLVTASELSSLVTGTNVSSLGFTLTTGVTGAAVTGSMTVYLQNTSDVSYLKGTSWATAITGMSNAYSGNMTIPVSAGSTSINLALAPTFTYTGGGIYVAYDWACAGPYSAGFATYAADNTMPVGGASASATIAPAPTILGNTNFRPCFIFGAVNSATNDVQVVGIIAPGKLPGSFNSPCTVNSVIKNASSGPLSNITVTMSVTGANTFSNTVNISSLAAGASTTIAFAAYTPTAGGLNSINVSTLPDQNNLNNASIYTQSVTCNVWAQIQPSQIFSSSVGFNTASGIIATRFVNPITATLNAISVTIGNTPQNAGNGVYCVLMNSGGVIQATTNTITITTPMYGLPQTFTLAPQTLLPGTYYLGLAQPQNSVTGYFPLAASPAAFVPTTIYYTSIIGGGFISNLVQNLGYFDIEGIFAQTTTISATSPSSVVCDGASITLTGIGANTYTWSTGSISPTISVSPTVATTYSVIGTNSVSCLANTSISLAVNPSPTVTAVSSLSTVCPGGAVNLTAGGAITYTWSNAATTTVTTVNPTVATTYSVVGTNTLGCNGTGTVAIAMNAPTITINSPTAICIGNSANLSASGANTYTWSTGSNGINIIVSPSVATSYSIAGTNSLGCVGTQSLSLAVNPNPTVSASSSPPAICKGESTTLTAVGAINYTLLSSGAPANFTATSVTSTISTVLSPTASITYTVVGTNSVGCSHTFNVSQIVNACVGIHENNGSSALISIFPNPTNGVFMLDITNSTGPLSIEIYTIIGEKVKAKKIDSGKNEINLNDQANGVYLIYVTENNKTIHISKVVKH